MPISRKTSTKNIKNMYTIFLLHITTMKLYTHTVSNIYQYYLQICIYICIQILHTPLYNLIYTSSNIWHHISNSIAYSAANILFRSITKHIKVAVCQIPKPPKISKAKVNIISCHNSVIFLVYFLLFLSIFNLVNQP